jgi:choline dehydrogenase-like flavoprotein
MHLTLTILLQRHQHTPLPFFPAEPNEDETWVAALAFVHCPQSHGTITLQSANPNDKPLIDPKFLTHPFDRRVMIESVREVTKLLKAPVYAKDTLRFYGPKDDSDEAIWVSIDVQK